MADVTTLRVYKDMYKYAHRLMQIVDNDFPKKFRYNLGEEIKKYAIMCVELICEANMLEMKEREVCLRRFVVKFKVLETLIKMTADERIIKQDVQAQIFRSAGSISKQIAGWIGYTRDNRASEVASAAVGMQVKVQSPHG